MNKVFCPICGKEYKDVKRHITQGHERDYKEVIQEAFGLVDQKQAAGQRAFHLNTLDRVQARVQKDRQLRQKRVQALIEAKENKVNQLKSKIRERINRRLT